MRPFSRLSDTFITERKAAQFWARGQSMQAKRLWKRADGFFEKDLKAVQKDPSDVLFEADLKELASKFKKESETWTEDQLLAS